MTISELRALYDGMVAVYRAAEHSTENHHLRVVHKHIQELAAHIDGIAGLPSSYATPNRAADGLAVMDTQAKARAADGSWMAPISNPDGAWLAGAKKTLPAAPSGTGGTGGTGGNWMAGVHASPPQPEAR